VSRATRAIVATAYLSAAALLAKVRRASWAPRLPITVSQWADAERVLSSAATPTPGPWRTDREPWQRGIMDSLHEPSDAIAVMKSGQLGVTECLLNMSGYGIRHDPGPQMLIEPSEALAKRVSKNRLATMLTETPSLRERVAPARSRTASSSLLYKAFQGGTLVLAGANSPTALSSDPIRWVFFDEIDKYPPHLGDEGDPISLGMKRTTKFWDRRHVLTSTPTIRGSSAIEKWFLQGDQRRYFVACPRCGHEDYFTWNDPTHFAVVFEGREPATAHLRCPAKGCRIEDHERYAMVAAGGWRATAPFRGVISFHVWEAYASTARLSRIVANFLRARELGREELREWTNQTLGEPWEDEAARVESHVLLGRRERFGDLVPAGALFLTMGVDTQDDRLEARVWGWGLGEESWLIDVRTLPGDPAKPEVWAMLDGLLEATWPHARGHAPRIAATAIDSAGHRTDHVYEYVRRTQHRHVRATIGRDGPRPIWTPGHKPRPGPGRRPVPLFVVGVDNAKALIVSRLRLKDSGPGYVHLPADHPAVDDGEIDQLTSEELATVYDKRKRRRQIWRQRRAGARNEALDCYVLALWALRDLRPDLRAAAQHLEATAPPAPPPPAEATPRAPSAPAAEPSPAPLEPTSPPPSAPAPAPSAQRVRQIVRSNYIGSW
jgi:phage terminase large subunit GpA-like protein